MTAAAAGHPVRRALRRLLVGVGACVAALLVLYLALNAVTERLLRTVERFHAPAIALGADLAATVASMQLPAGVAPDVVDQITNPTLFVAAVSRDAGRAQALLEALQALHRSEADPAFAAAQRRFGVALDELRAVERAAGGDPLALARSLAVRPLYAAVVAEQTMRLHRAASRALQARHDLLQRVLGGLFALTALALVGGFFVQMRRGLRGIDAVLERERASFEALNEAQALARLGNFEIDLAGGPPVWSAEMFRLFGVEARAGVPAVDDWLARVAPDDRPRLAAAVADPSEATLAALGTLRVLRPDGAERHLALQARLDRDAAGRPLRLLGTAQDVTERRLAEQSLARSRDELERLVGERTFQLTAARDAAVQANRAKSDFLSRMSHELRTPMNAVLGFAQLLGLETALSAKGREYVDHVLRAGKHLLHLINDVLDLAQVESGRMTLSPEPLEIEALVREVVALMQPVAAQHGVTIEPPRLGPAVLRGDRLRVKQVLLNLVSNAVKYNRPGGWVRVATSPAADGRVRLEVADSGQGITADGLGQLFQPFARLGAETGPVEGTGIGLSICRRLVEMMGGRIGVDSTPGVGSTFWVELPQDRLAPPPPATLAGPLTRPGAIDGGHACVLYVEDNPDNLLLVQRIVARHPGIELIDAPTARHGFDLAVARRPDLILLDIHLPGENGYGLLARLRAHPDTRAIPTIAVTANAMPGEAQKAAEAGFAEYVTKPLDIGRFDALLQRHLGQAAG